MGEEMVLKNQQNLVRFSHRLGESIRKPLWTHGVASKVLRPRFNRAQKTTPGVQMKKPICTTASARTFLIGDEKCGLAVWAVKYDIMRARCAVGCKSIRSRFLSIK